MDKYKIQYLELTSEIQSKVDDRESKRSTWIDPKKIDISKDILTELRNLFDKAQLSNWETFVSGTINIIRMGRATFQLQKNGQPVGKQLSQGKKAIKNIKQLLNIITDENFPYDSLINSYLGITEYETENKNEIARVKDLRNQICKSLIALSMFVDGHEKARYSHKNNFDFFIIELSRLFERHNGKISIHTETHFYQYVGLCMKVMETERVDYKPIIKKALKTKLFIDNNPL